MLRGIPDSRSVKFPPHLEQPATLYLWALLIAGLPCTTRSLHFCGFCQIMLKPEYLFHCVKTGREEDERAEDGIVRGPCTGSDWELHRSCDGHAVALKALQKWVGDSKANWPRLMQTNTGGKEVGAWKTSGQSRKCKRQEIDLWHKHGRRKGKVFLKRQGVCSKWRKIERNIGRMLCWIGTVEKC